MAKVTQIRTDALIIGGGPAGVSAAIAIRFLPELSRAACATYFAAALS
jgi:succinate dehydrogenase/fumarate reductase flavoprotein subunit